MTGFGRGTHSSGLWLANVEVASINRKQLEIVANLPRALLSLEASVRKFVTPMVSRGRIQVTVRLERSEESGGQGFRVDPALARSLEAAFSDLSAILQRKVSPASSDFLRQPGLIEIGESETADPDTAWESVRPALSQAMDALAIMRATEGDHMKTDFLERLGRLLAFTATISNQAPNRPERNREMLLKRLADLDLDISADDERLAKELALFADRCDISEEITRLHSHFAKFHDYVHSSEPAGRPLDFLCQELFREFNTIASKANDAVIAQTVVEAKTELEKLREQIQNIE